MRARVDIEGVVEEAVDCVLSTQKRHARIDNSDGVPRQASGKEACLPQLVLQKVTPLEEVGQACVRSRRCCGVNFKRAGVKKRNKAEIYENGEDVKEWALVPKEEEEEAEEEKDPVIVTAFYFLFYFF